MKNTTLRELSHQIQNRSVSAKEVAERALGLARLSDSVFTRINEGIVEQAEQVDYRISAGGPTGPLAGIPVTLKDLYDVKGEKTLAGSIVLKHKALPASRDSDVVARLRNAGMLFLGRVNMSEFAFSGMGLNPHYGTPKSVWDRRTGRLAGGSSSGSAVSVAEGIVPVSMGSDTAGSCRIPASFNGIVGVKPSYGRLSLAGVYPLSHSSDTPGPLGMDVDSCFIIDQLLCGQWNGVSEFPVLEEAPLRSLRLLVPEEGSVLDGLDAAVEKAFEHALSRLAETGVKIIRKALPVIDDCMDMFMTRAIAGFEAYQQHRGMLMRYGHRYDPFVRKRLMSFRTVSHEEQQSRYALKARLRGRFEAAVSKEGADAVLYPTTPCVPPRIPDTLDAEDVGSINLRCLRNTATVNNFDGCSISLPCHENGQPPAGLMISSGHGTDMLLYRIAAGVERALGRACRDPGGTGTG